MTNKSISQLTAGAAVSSTDLFPDVQTAGVGPVKVTAAQIGDYVLSGSGLTGVLPVSRGGTGIGSLGTGVATALGNAVNGASGLCVQDASGNLGLGVTPSAWGAFTVLQNKNFSLLGYDYGQGLLVLNGYYDGSVWKAISTGASTQYKQFVGQHIWYTGASVSAGNPISFTQAMTLDASGNLALGTSSASSRLHIVATSSDLASAFGNVAVFSNDSQAQDKGGSIGFGGVYTGTSIAQWAGIRGAKENGTDGNFAGYMSFFTRANGGSTTERARITSAGDLLVGTTSVSSKLTVYSSTGGGGYFFISNSSSQATSAITLSKYDNDNSTSQIFCQFVINNQGTGSGQINANGANTAAFGTFSDARLKENIVDLSPQLSNILALRPREFDYIESEGGGHQIGFVAQEMQLVYPDAVGKRADGMLTVTAWSKTEARLVKAIQELAAEVAALKGQING